MTSPARKPIPQRPARPAKRPPKPPQTLLELFQLLLKKFLIGLIWQIPLAIIVFVAVWLFHTWLMVYVNEGFAPGGSGETVQLLLQKLGLGGVPFLGGFVALITGIVDALLATRGRGFLTGTLFWMLLMSLLVGTLVRFIWGPVTFFKDGFGAPAWVARTLSRSRPPMVVLACLFGGGAAGMAAGIVIGHPFLLGSRLLALVMGLHGLTQILARGGTLTFLIARLGWSDFQKWQDKTRPVKRFRQDWMVAAVLGLTAGLLVASVLPFLLFCGCAGFLFLLVGTLLAVFLGMAKGKGAAAPAAAALLMVFGSLVLTLISIPLYADDGGWKESGGTMQSWLNSPGSGVAMGLGLGPAAGAVAGILAGGLAGTAAGVAAGAAAGAAEGAAAGEVGAEAGAAGAAAGEVGAGAGAVGAGAGAVGAGAGAGPVSSALGSGATAAAAIPGIDEPVGYMPSVVDAVFAGEGQPGGPGGGGVAGTLGDATPSAGGPAPDTGTAGAAGQAPETPETGDSGADAGGDGSSGPGAGDGGDGSDGGDTGDDGGEGGGDGGDGGGDGGDGGGDGGDGGGDGGDGGGSGGDGGEGPPEPPGGEPPKPSEPIKSTEVPLKPPQDASGAAAGTTTPGDTKPSDSGYTQDTKEVQQYIDRANATADPAKLEELKNKFQQMMNDKTDEQYFVKNEDLVTKIWNSLPGAMIRDWWQGNHLWQCGEFAEWGQQWSQEFVKQTFGPGAVVDTINVQEASSAAAPAGWTDIRSGRDLVNKIDAIYEADHGAVRVILPTGERLVLDYWECMGRRGGQAKIYTEQEWLDKWREEIGHYDFKANNVNGPMQELGNMVHMYENRGKTDIDAFNAFKKKYPDVADTYINSWLKGRW